MPSSSRSVSAEAFERTPMPRRIDPTSTACCTRCEARGLDGIVATLARQCVLPLGLQRHRPQVGRAARVRRHAVAPRARASDPGDCRLLPGDLPDAADLGRGHPPLPRGDDAARPAGDRRPTSTASFRRRRVGQAWVESARRTYGFDMGSVAEGRTRGAEARSPPRSPSTTTGFGLRLGIEGMTVADGYDPMMFARSVKSAAELDLLRRSTPPQRGRHPQHRGFLGEGRHLARPQHRLCALGGRARRLRARSGGWCGAIRAARTPPSCSPPASRTARSRPAPTSCSTATAPSTSTAGTAARPGWSTASREGDAKRWAKATSASAETLISAMKPGARIASCRRSPAGLPPGGRAGPGSGRHLLPRPRRCRTWSSS